jgi:hypothetical protein
MKSKFQGNGDLESFPICLIKVYTYLAVCTNIIMESQPTVLYPSVRNFQNGFSGMLAQALFHKLFSTHVTFEGEISLQEATDWGALSLILRWREMRLRISLIKDTVPNLQLGRVTIRNIRGYAGANTPVNI